MRLKLHHQIFLAMIIGAGVGLPLNILAEHGRVDPYWPRTIAAYGKGLGDVFLRLLSMIVAPLILTSLITGVTGTGNLKGLGRMGGRTLAYYISTSMIAIITGMLVFNVIQPGKNSDLGKLQEGAEVVTFNVGAADQTLGQTMWNQVFNLIPSNPFASLADASNKSILGVIFFALLFNEGPLFGVREHERVGFKAGRGLAGGHDLMDNRVASTVPFQFLGVGAVLILLVCPVALTHAVLLATSRTHCGHDPMCESCTHFAIVISEFIT